MLRFLCIMTLALLPSISAFADTIRLADGTSCSFDADDSNTELTFGAGRDSTDYSQHGDDAYNLEKWDRNDGFGISLTYRFGTPERLDCKALYDMELERRRLELELMKKKLAVMEKAQQIDW